MCAPASKQRPGIFFAPPFHLRGKWGMMTATPFLSERDPPIMQHRHLGRTKIEMSAIIFGGWQAGVTGATGVRFLQELKRLLQNPLSLME